VRSNFALQGITATAGGVAIVGQDIVALSNYAAFLLQLDVNGVFVQARAYTNGMGPNFGVIGTTTTPGFVIGGNLPYPWVLSTYADGTVAGTCDMGFAMSGTIALTPSTLLSGTSPHTVSAFPVVPANATLTTTTDGYTLSAQCHL
jgi:hypothetical protein